MRPSSEHFLFDFPRLFFNLPNFDCEWK